MLLPHHGFTVLLTEISKVPIEISEVLSVFSKVLTVFPCVPAVLPCEKVMVVCLSLCSSYTELTLRYKLPLSVYYWKTCMAVKKIRIAHVEICECIYLLNTALCNLLKHVSCWNICSGCCCTF